MSNNRSINALCLKCGLCCNGVIFADVRLQSGDNASRLKALGLPIANLHGPKFPQPCRALDGCRCQIYEHRPEYCRQFECRLLKDVNAGQTSVKAALRTIKTAQARAERVRALLRMLGDAAEHVALSVRYRRMVRAINEAAPRAQMADAFGELTLAVQDLNLLLSEAFYPGSSSEPQSRPSQTAFRQ